MIRSLLAMVAWLGVLATPVLAQAPFNPEPLLSEAIAAVRGAAYRSGQVDWPALEAAVRAKAAGARDPLDLLPAYVVLLDGLGDHHSFVQATPAQERAYVERHGRSVRSASGIVDGPMHPPSAFARRPREARDLSLAGRRTARLLVVPAFSGYPPEAQAYTDGLFQSLAESAGRACGYVVDLRGNGGGNMWPMVTGLSPLLGDSMALGKQDAEGPPYVYANLRSGAAVIAQGGGAPNRLQAVQGWRDLGIARAPVAILQDRGVASSGEAVLAAFAGRRDTRSFGERSAGLASSNSGYRLSDGTNLVITTGMMTDRAGRTYPEGFSPDEAVAEGPGKADDPEDAVVEAAMAWLARQPACR